MKKILAAVILVPFIWAVGPILAQMVLVVVAVVGVPLVGGYSILWALGEFFPGVRKEFNLENFWDY